MKFTFFVLGDDEPQLLVKDAEYPKRGVLLSDTDQATSFKSRRSAQRAIDRTQKYSDRSHHLWSDRKYAIIRTAVGLTSNCGCNG